MVTFTDCPAIAMPMLSPGCTLSPSENDANGCPLAPNVICTSEGRLKKDFMLLNFDIPAVSATTQPLLVNTGSDNSVTKPSLASCPAIEPPTLGPGCITGPPLTDANGCPLPSKPICFHGHGILRCVHECYDFKYFIVYCFEEITMVHQLQRVVCNNLHLEIVIFDNLLTLSAVLQNF